MKKIYLFILFLLHSLLPGAQQVNLNFAKSFGGNSLDFGNSIAVDAAGNIYTCGHFSETVDFNPGPGILNLTSNGDADIFIVKSDPNGNLVWARSVGGLFHDYARSIALDAEGNIYVSGGFIESVDFDPGPGIHILTSTGSYDAYVLKLSNSGNFLWAKAVGTAGPNEWSYSYACVTDLEGNIYTTGNFESTADFDPGPGTYNLNCSGYANCFFLSRLDKNGNFLWAKQFQGMGNQTGFSIHIDAEGNILSTGRFDSTTDFDPGPGTYFLTPSGGNAASFILKLDKNGNFLWARQIQGSGYSYGYNIAADLSGNVYASGVFTGTCDMDPGTGVMMFTSLGLTDGYILKLDANGNFVWAKQYGGTGEDAAYAIALDQFSNIFIAGNFENVAEFNSAACEPFISKGYQDIYILSLDSSGTFIWAKQFGGNDRDAPADIAVDFSGNIYSTGSYSDTVDFDPGPGVLALTGVYADVFLLKLSPCTDSYTTLNVATCSNFKIGCHTYYYPGNYTVKIQSAKGCDSIVNLNLTIIDAPAVTSFSATACNFYVWNGKTYSASGIYSDTITTINGCDSVVVLQLSVNQSVSTHINATICKGENYAGHTISGTYTETFPAYNNCDSIRTLNLVVIPDPQPSLGPDFELCKGDSVLLSPGSFDSYLWNNGASNKELWVKQPGIYSVKVSNQCSSAYDEIYVSDGPCDIWFPNSFTPNGDGKNETFKALTALPIEEFELFIYNRWGQLVFQTKDPLKSWNGELSGLKQPTGNYIWFCHYKRKGNGKQMLQKGTVLLIR